jgi:uncharacterized protein (UPF0333 family)
MKDRQFNIAFSVMMAAILLVVLIIGYIAISMHRDSNHRDCMTRQDTRELVDSMLMEVYD